MSLTLTEARAVLLGVPIVATDDATAWAFGNFKAGSPYCWPNLFNRYLGQTSVLRGPVNSDEIYRLAFGFSGAFPDSIDGVALVSTNFKRTTTVRLRYMDGGPFWIEHPYASLSGTAQYFKAGSSALAFTRANLTSAMTVGCWIYPTTIDVTERGIISFKTGGASQYPYDLSIVSGGSNPKLRVRYTHSGGTAASADSSESAALATSTWAHVGFSVTGAALTFYINGAAAGTATLDAASRDAANGTQMEVGRGGSGTQFQGGLSDLRVWNAAVALSTSGLIHRIEQSAALSSAEYLVLYFPFGQKWRTDGNEFSCAAADLLLLDDAHGAGTATCAWLQNGGSMASYSGTRVGAGGSVTDYAAVDAFSGGLSAAQHARRRRDIWRLISSSAAGPGSFQVDLCDVDSDSGTDEERSIGRLLAAPGMQLSRGVALPSALQLIDPSIVEQIPSGQIYSQPYTPYRSQELQFNGLTTSEAMRKVIEDVGFLKGTTGDFYFIIDPSSRSYAEQQSYYARLASAQSFGYGGTAWQVNMTLEELRS
jgi:hypothetical protein